MIESLSPVRRRLLALSILAAVATVLYAVTVVPLRALNEHQRDTIERLEIRLQTLQRQVAAGSVLRARQEQLQASLAGSPQYLQSKTYALSAADLQGIIKRISAANATQLLSTQILPTQEEADFTRVALKARLRGPLARVVKVLYSLETGQPYLFLDDVSIRRLGVVRYNKDTDDSLDLDFELIGYMRQSP